MTVEKTLIKNLKGAEGHGSILVIENGAEFHTILSVTDCFLDENGVLATEEYKDIIVKRSDDKGSAVKFAQQVQALLISKYGEDVEDKDLNFTLQDEIQIYV